jgi:hypothetical protein
MVVFNPLAVFNALAVLIPLAVLMPLAVFRRLAVASLAAVVGFAPFGLDFDFAGEAGLLLIKDFFVIAIVIIPQSED